MPHAILLQTTPFAVPADCFNRLRLLRLRSNGPLEFGLPGLPGIRMVIRRHQWQCWSRPLGALLMTWHDFHTSRRADICSPVACTLSVHHPYARTVIHRIHDSLWQHCARPSNAAQEGAAILGFRPP